MLYDPHRRWAPRGICRWEDRKLFFADGGQPNRRPGEAVQRRWDQAKDICKMCPVLKECRRDSLGEEFGVYGGLDEFQRWHIRKALPGVVKSWPESKRLAWGREIHGLRQIGLHWSAIQYRTGMPQSAATDLLNLWEERIEAAKASKSKVTDLELPEMPEEKDKRPFPPGVGRRHAWVRDRGLVSDAWYRGETPDGEWICVTVFAGRGNSHKWLRKDDVRLYRPQTVVILNYVGRPDDNSRTPAA
ncbi:WhiB family transcriptional regulator [Streptomyces sp. NPDC010273]|uniref:WhiB family transcriptional regulator n=1 Tax=Streptomyces sp. NPDC010273 TaxID=3364829 RepID=UPI0036E6A6C5